MVSGACGVLPAGAGVARGRQRLGLLVVARSGSGRSSAQEIAMGAPWWCVRSLEAQRAGSSRACPWLQRLGWLPEWFGQPTPVVPAGLGSAREGGLELVTFVFRPCRSWRLAGVLSAV